MRAVWDLVLPSTTAGSDPKASPLLGNLKDLSKHAIFVAGQDPLRDEGITYAKTLETEGVDTSLFMYKGVPHVFAEFWELETTQNFWSDIRGVLKKWLA
jgi:acetyl esterase/lipase